MRQPAWTGHPRNDREQAACLGIAGITAHRAGTATAPTAALVDGDLRSTVATRLPLQEIARAHDLVERGAGGRLLLEIR